MERQEERNPPSSAAASPATTPALARTMGQASTTPLETHRFFALGALASGIAHDLNNVLFTISLNVEMALQDVAPEEKALRHSIEEALRASERAKDLVQQILAFAQTDGGKAEVIQVMPAVSGALKFLRAALPATIAIRPTMKAPRASLIASPAVLHAILVDLSVLATRGIRGHEGVLEVSVEQASLRKSGLRNSPNLMPGPYLRFRFAAKITLDPGSPAPSLPDVPDTGWVTTAAKSMGGAVSTMGCEEADCGYELLLPAVTPEGATRSSRKRSLPTGAERILLVDDEPAIADVAKRALRGLGYTVRTALGAREALETFRSAPGDFDLVITDRTMPVMTGEKLAAKIKDLRPEIPIILMTGDGTPPPAARTKVPAIAETLSKPLTLQHMAEIVRRVLDGN